MASDVFNMRSHLQPMPENVQEKRFRAFAEDDGMVFELWAKIPKGSAVAMFLHAVDVRRMHQLLGDWLNEHQCEWVGRTLRELRAVSTHESWRYDEDDGEYIGQDWFGHGLDLRVSATVGSRDVTTGEPRSMVWEVSIGHNVVHVGYAGAADALRGWLATLPAARKPRVGGWTAATGVGGIDGAE